MNCAGTERAGALYVQPDPNSGARYDLASKANSGFKRFFCWSRRACDRSLSFGLETPRCGSRLLAQWRSRSLGRSEEHTSELQSLMRISYAVFCLTKNKPQDRTKY